MKQHSSTNAPRKGQFLWMEPADRNLYVERIKKRILDNYYFTDVVFTNIAEELAAVLEEAAVSD